MIMILLRCRYWLVLCYVVKVTLLKGNFADALSSNTCHLGRNVLPSGVYQCLDHLSPRCRTWNRSRRDDRFLLTSTESENEGKVRFIVVFIEEVIYIKRGEKVINK